MADEVLTQVAIDALLAGDALPPKKAAIPSDYKPEAGKDNKDKNKGEKAEVPDKAMPSTPLKQAAPAKTNEPVAEKTPPEAKPVTAVEPVEEKQSDPIPAVAQKSSPASSVSHSIECTEAIEPLRAAMDNLTKRTVATEAIMQKLNALENDLAVTKVELLSQNSNQAAAKVLQLEMKMSEINTTIQILMSNMGNTMNLVDATKSQMNSIMQRLDNTLGDNIRETFECQMCGSRGYVLGLVKCSECGDENWWGWWAPEDEEFDYDEDWEHMESYAGEECYRRGT